MDWARVRTHNRPNWIVSGRSLIFLSIETKNFDRASAKKPPRLVFSSAMFCQTKVTPNWPRMVIEDFFRAVSLSPPSLSLSLSALSLTHSFSYSLSRTFSCNPVCHKRYFLQFFQVGAIWVLKNFEVMSRESKMSPFLHQS